MLIYVLPMLMALLSKVWVYFFARKYKCGSPIILSLLILLSTHDLLAILAISVRPDDLDSQITLLRLDYLLLTFLLALLCMYVTTIVQNKRRSWLGVIALNFAFLYSVVLIFSDLIIADAVRVNSGVTPVKGSYYLTFQILVLISLATIIFTLIKRYIDTTEILMQLKYFYTLLALLPIILIFLALLMAMQTEHLHIRSLLLSIAGALTLSFLVITRKHQDIMKLRWRLPLTIYKKTEKQILTIIREQASGHIKLPDAKKDIERLLVQLAIDRTENNVSRASDILGIERSTLYAAFQRLNIKRDRHKD